MDFRTLTLQTQNLLDVRRCLTQTVAFIWMLAVNNQVKVGFFPTVMLTIIQPRYRFHKANFNNHRD